MDKEPFPTLFHFPSLDRFVIFDFETTGLEEEAQPFQLSALKVEDWKIVGYFNSYANASLRDMPYSLRRKLRIDEIEETVLSAPQSEEVVKDFLSFISDFPLIAHNAWFDIRLLRRFKPDLTNPFLDSIELFFLAFPITTSYSLEELSHLEGVEEELSSLQKEFGGEELFPHNALYDCLVLFCLLKRAVEKLRKSPSASLLHFVAPQLAQNLGIPHLPLAYICDSLLPPTSNFNSEEVEERGYGFNKDEVLEFYDRWVKEAGVEKRESQRTMVEKVAETFENGRIGMIEAPTGTGKTLAYLIPSAFLVRRGGGKVIVATYTKHLQTQILSDFETKLAGYLTFNRPIRYVLLKGQGNYLCLRCLFGRMEDAFINFPSQTGDDEKFLLIYLSRFVEEIKDKIEDLDAIPFLLNRVFPFLGSLKENIKSNRDICRRGQCAYYERCFFWKARKAAEDADIVITNHWRLLMGKWENPQNYSLIIDEAHNLEDSATDAFGRSVSKESLTTLLALLLNKEGDRGLIPKITRVVGNLPEQRGAYAVVRNLWTLTDEIAKSLNSYLKSEGRRIHPIYGASLWMRTAPRKRKRWRAVIGKAEELLSNCRDLERYKEGLKQPLTEAGALRLWEELDAIVKNLSSGASKLKELLDWEYDKDKKARWIEVALLREDVEARGLNIENLPSEFLSEPPGELLNWAVKEAPIKVSEFLEEKLYKVFRSIVLTSATLTVAGKGFGFFLDRLGLENYISDEYLVSLPPVFNYRDNVLLAFPNYLPSDASQQNIEEFKRDVLEELAEFISYVEGRTLVLFAARDRLEWVGRNLEPILTERRLPLYWQRPGASKRHLLREFKEVEEATLMGLRSFWEGVDVPGASLCHLVVEKLPFPSIADPLIRARREEVRERGEDEFTHYLLPLSLLLFKQGFGRLIRSHRDRGVVIFLDKRLRSDVAIRESALQTLPGFTRIEEAEGNRKTLYKAVQEHMLEYYRKEVAPDFPWEEKLERVKEVGYTPPSILPKDENPLGQLRDEGSFLLEAQDPSPIMDFLLGRGEKVVVISPIASISRTATPYKGELVYLSAPPSLGVKKLLADWREGKIKALVLHPYWLEFELMRENLGEAQTVIVPNALYLHYSSTFFDPFIVKNIPEVKRKIFLLPPALREQFDEEPSFMKEMEIIPLQEDAPSVNLGRAEDILPFLRWSEEKGGNVLIYTPGDGRKLEEQLNKLGFLARYWEVGTSNLFIKDELPILILPPGQRVDVRGITMVIHYPPMGDKAGFLVEAYQAGGKGLALSCLKRDLHLPSLIDSMFPNVEDIEEMREKLGRKGEVFLNLDSKLPRALRILYILWEEKGVDWRIVEREVELIRLKEIEDKNLREVLERLGISDKRTKRIDLLEVSRQHRIPLSALLSLIRESWQREEISYDVRKWGILVRGRRISGATPRPPVSKEEILEEWQKLQEWVSSLPLIPPP